MLAATCAVALVGAAGARAAAEIASTCVSCHEQDEDEDVAAPVEEWRRSVHAAADVGCDACHGGDPSAEDQDDSMDEDASGFLGAPGRREIGEFCGACHEEIAQAFAESVMAQKLAAGERVATCVTCHMDEGHAIAPPVTAEILTEERCGRCHDGARALELRGAIDAIDDAIARADAGLAPLRHGIDTSRLDRVVGDARARAVTLAHTYDIERIRAGAASTREQLAQVERDTSALARELERRRSYGLGAVSFLAMCFAGMLRLSHQLRRRNGT